MASENLYNEIKIYGTDKNKLCGKQKNGCFTEQKCIIV